MKRLVVMAVILCSLLTLGSASKPADVRTSNERPAGTDCSTPVVFDDQWANGYRLVCQNNVYVLMVDLTNPAVKVDVAAASPTSVQSLPTFADGNTIAMINADYQWYDPNTGQSGPQGLTISNGSDPMIHTNKDHLCSDASVRREIGLSQDGRPTIDWWYRFVSDSQARSWCVSLAGPGGGLEQYSYNLVGAGPQFTFDGTFKWECGYGSKGTPGASDCNTDPTNKEVIINGEHFGTSASTWWNRYQSATGYSSDGTVLVLGESNNSTHTMQAIHDVLYQRLGVYGKTLKNAFKFDSGSLAGFWYYDHTYDSTPNVNVPSVIRVQRTNSTCYSVSTNVNPSGAGSISLNTSSNCAQGKYTPGTNVQLIANANSGYSFTSWSGCDSPSGNTCALNMNANKAVTANFALNIACYSLTTNVNPGGSGAVGASPPPNCPTDNTKYSQDTTVTMTANPNSGYTFSLWSGDASGSANPTSLSMNSDKTVTANFALNIACYSLIANVSPGGAGTVGASPLPNCSNDNTKYSQGTLVTLTAFPNSGYTFNLWSGDASGSANPTSLSMNSNKNVTASFSVVPALLIGSVTLQGRPAPPDPRWITPLRVSLSAPGVTTPLYSFTPTTDNTGHFTVTGMTSGLYDLRVKNSHTLQNTITNVNLVGGTNSVDLGTLLEGDANDDNFVTLLDFSTLASTFGKCLGSTGYDLRADFNVDQCVTLLDFSRLASNFGRAGMNTPLLLTTQPEVRVSPKSAQLVLSPSALVVKRGQVFTMTVQVRSGTQVIDAAQASLDFDPRFLKVRRVTAGSKLSVGLLNRYDNGGGTLDFAAGTFSSLPSGTFSLVEVQFEVVAPAGVTTLKLHTGPQRNSDITFAGASMLANTSPSVIVVQATSAR